MGIRHKIVLAIFKRNFSSYFAGVLGYLFIVVFVLASGALAFNAKFFTANEPNLDQLTEWFPQLLLFFVPAITMSVWAEERKMGTDELLFTLPATDLEVLLGKYFATLTVYTVALVFSTTLVLVLMYLGNPDWGLLTTTYFGYWIAGAALISAGMLASILTNNMTVAFVLGIVICIGPVYVGDVAAFVGLSEWLEPFSLREQFRDFGMGVIPFTAIMYFTGFTAVMLYLNLVMMSKRHWKSDRSLSVGAQYAARAICVAVVVSCVTAWAGYTAIRVDATTERLFSLSPTTRKILRELEAERPIEIQAFISPDVPREYVDTRKLLVGLLRQFDEMGGRNLEVRFVDVETDSLQAEEAERFGIRPVQVLSDRDGRRSQVDVFLGAVVISSYDKVVVPFFGKGLPIEYELTRSVQTVAQEERLTVGILETDAGLTGGRDWQIVQELKKQYNVEDVSPVSSINKSDFDVLIAVMPSSLTDPQMDNFVDYVKNGNPVLIFDDPFPMAFSNQFGVSNAPRQPKPSRGGGMGGMFGGGQPPPEQKADGGRATRLLDALGVNWQYDRVVFDGNNPHPEFEMLPQEYIFVTNGGGGTDLISKENEVTRGLEELIVIYAGSISKRTGANVDFTPLFSSGTTSGLLNWSEFVDEGGFNMFSMQAAASPLQDPYREIDREQHVIAAKIDGGDDHPVNAIFVADVDVISDFFFQERNLSNLNMQFDNVTFILNAVDHLANNNTYIELRSRRKKHRTLTRIEAKKREFLTKANKSEKAAKKEADKELAERKEQLGKRVKEIEADDSLDPIAKQQLVANAQRAEQQRLSLAEAQIEQKKNDEVRKIHASTNRQERSLESAVRNRAVMFLPLPALLLGFIVFCLRMSAESSTVDPTRRRS
jgi:ABC-2 type transport system permease protein